MYFCQNPIMNGQPLSVISAQNHFSIRLKELWQYRELFYFFTWRDIKVKYKQTVLGFLWALLQPTLMALVFTLFFGNALKVPSEGMPYPVFVLSGLILWNVFASSLNSAGSSMISNAQIIKKIYFPRLIIPISSILVSLFDFLMTLPALICIGIIYHVPLDLIQGALFFPVGLLLTIVSSTGLSCFLAALNVKYRDFRYVVPFVIQVLLFLTPVIYPTSIINKDWLKYIMALNPMYSAITLFRSPLSVGVSVNIVLVAISATTAFLFLFGGLWYFKRTENYFADLA